MKKPVITKTLPIDEDLDSMFSNSFKSDEALSEQKSAETKLLEDKLKDMQLQFSVVMDKLEKVASGKPAAPLKEEKIAVPSSFKKTVTEKIKENAMKKMNESAPSSSPQTLTETQPEIQAHQISSIAEAEAFIHQEKLKQSKAMINEVVSKVKKSVQSERNGLTEDATQDASDIASLKQQMNQLAGRVSNMAMSGAGGGGGGGGATKLFDLDDTDYTSVKTPLAGDILTFDSVLGKWIAAPAVPTGNWVHEKMTVGAANQLVYNITTLPILPTATYVTMNGVLYNTADYFVLAGTTVTLDSTFFGAAGPVDIKTTDEIVVSYVA